MKLIPSNPRRSFLAVVGRRPSAKIAPVREENKESLVSTQHQAQQQTEYYSHDDCEDSDRQDESSLSLTFIDMTKKAASTKHVHFAPTPDLVDIQGVQASSRTYQESLASWYTPADIQRFKEDAKQAVLQFVQNDTRAASLCILFDVFHATDPATARNFVANSNRVRFTADIVGLDKYIIRHANNKARSSAKVRGTSTTHQRRAHLQLLQQIQNLQHRGRPSMAWTGCRHLEAKIRSVSVQHSRPSCEYAAHVVGRAIARDIV